MKHFKHLLNSSLVILFLFSFTIATESANAQQMNKVFDEIGGGGGSSNRSEDSGSGNTMYIVGGVIIVGVLLYALLRDKKEPEKKDTVSVLTDKNLFVHNSNFNKQSAVDQSEIPLNFYIGLQNQKAVRENKRYIIGVSYNF